MRDKIPLASSYSRDSKTPRQILIPSFAPQLVTATSMEVDWRKIELLFSDIRYDFLERQAAVFERLALIFKAGVLLKDLSQATQCISWARSKIESLKAKNAGEAAHDIVGAVGKFLIVLR